ncbi:MAG: tRNA (N(6)-L-threonylcarbamoyladenosine(37)-C(2))-methylthiotransferase MtaB [Ruminiclostridium sp.]|nr:tRNA (N(6)-L-threonylcarbamoyladenosine(37)-C(2))-methylthiotransferase MtaB [Ruminiclostridium sp.]
MKYDILTFGCKVNQYESTAIGNYMQSRGFSPCEDGETPDAVIINSCSVTENGDKKARHAVRAAKKRYPGAVVVLTGCYPQADPAGAAECGADIVAGTAHRGEIPELITEFLAGRRAAADMTLPEAFEELGIRHTTDKTRAFIKIEDGCDRYCSYCIIPYARGKVRSRGVGRITEEAELCAREGHREIVLVGINLSRYGSDIGLDLADAVKAASVPEGIERVRLSSLEPELLDEDIVSRLAECKKLCPHFHISVQSGCDATLRRMNRHYDTAGYMDIISRLRRWFPGCAITTDVMVGFAGETDEEFAQSLEFVRRAGFQRVHVFTYSVRRGTAAEKRTDHVPESIKSRRYAEMSALAEKLSSDSLSAQKGRNVRILVQKRTSPDYAEGLTDDYIPVRVYGSDAKKHDLINVRITGTGDGYCTGEVL